MGRASESKVAFDIFDDDPSSCEDGHFLHNEAQLRSNRFSALRQVSLAESQNRQSSTGSHTSTETLRSNIRNTRTTGDNYELKHRRLTRPSIAPDTFNSLQTVPESEDESHISHKSATSNSADSGPRCLQLPGMSLPTGAQKKIVSQLDGRY